MTTKTLSGELRRPRHPRKMAANAALFALLASQPAYADPIKLHIACTATSDCASAMVARDEGIFAKHGLDVDMTLIGINTNIPPAIVSDSIQIGGPTSPSWSELLLQAKYKAISGFDVMSSKRVGNE